MKCAFDICTNDGECFVGNNLNKGTLPMCKRCLKEYEKHHRAREDEFYRRGKEDERLLNEKAHDEFLSMQAGALKPEVFSFETGGKK